MREYDDDDIGELDYDDPLTRGHAHISKFDNVISDFLINTCVPQEKYQTPAEIGNAGNDKPNGIHTKHEEKADDINNKKEGLMLLEFESSEEEKELIIAEDTDEEDEAWDCETIVTTFSNLDNHPGKIYSSDKGSSKGIVSGREGKQSVIRLRGKQQIPIDYLPRQKPEKGKSNDRDRKSSEVQEMARQRTGETKEEKKARKVRTLLFNYQYAPCCKCPFLFWHRVQKLFKFFDLSLFLKLVKTINGMKGRQFRSQTHSSFIRVNNHQQDVVALTA